MAELRVLPPAHKFLKKIKDRQLIENNEKGQKRRRITMKDGIQQIIDKYTKIGEQRGIEQGKQEGIEQGIKQGVEQGISIFITDKVDDGVDYDTIREKLIIRFKLTPDSADSYMKKYAVKKKNMRSI